MELVFKEIPMELKVVSDFIDSVMSINKETYNYVLTKAKALARTRSRFVIDVLHYAILIRPCQFQNISNAIKQIKKVIDIKPRNTAIFNYGHNSENVTYLVSDTTKYELIEDLEQILINDDIGPFIKFAEKQNMASSRSFISKNESFFGFLDSNCAISLPALTCFYGAIKCFNYLCLNESFDANNLVKFAVAGGNMEIIRRLEQRNISFNNCYSTAIKYHRHQILKFLIEKKCKGDEKIKQIATFSYNYLAFFNIEKKKPTQAIINDTLFCAVQSNQFELVKYLINTENGNVGAKRNNLSTPQIAAIYDNIEILKYLIFERHAEVMKCDETHPKNEAINFLNDLYDNTIYLCRILNCGSNISEVKQVIAANFVDVNIKLEDSPMPLSIALTTGKLDIIKYLIEEQHADITLVDKASIKKAMSKKDSELTDYLTNAQKAANGLYEPVNANRADDIFTAIETSNMDRIKSFLDDSKFNINQQDNRGRSPLFFATEKGNTKVVKYLIKERKAELGKLYVYPLICAIKSGSLEIVKSLVEAFVSNIKQQLFEGKIPLTFAAESGNLKIVEYFVDRCNANVNSKDATRKTPLQIAVEKGDNKIAGYLIKKGAKVDVEDNNHKNALIIAAETGNTDFFKALVGANNKMYNGALNFRDFNGKSLLIISIENGQKNLVKYFVTSCPINIEVPDNQGRTPLIVATEKGDLEIVKILVKQKARIDVMDQRKRSPLAIATSYGHDDIVKYLNKEIKASKKLLIPN